MTDTVLDEGLTYFCAHVRAVYVCGVSMCVQVCKYTCRGQRRLSPPYSFQTGSLTEPGARLGDRQQAPVSSLISALLPTHTHRERQTDGQTETDRDRDRQRQRDREKKLETDRQRQKERETHPWGYRSMGQW